MTVNRLGLDNRAIAEPDGVLQAVLGKGDNYLEPGLARVARCLLVGVKVHVEGDAGVDLRGAQAQLARLGRRVRPRAHRPLEVHVERAEVLELEGQHAAVGDRDLREGVDERLGLVLGRRGVGDLEGVLPCEAEVWRRGRGRVRAVLVLGDGCA